MLTIAGKTFRNRLVLGTGKYKDFATMKACYEAARVDMITLAVRRFDLGAQGSVAYLFSKQGQIVVEASVSEDQIMEVALEAGADDVVQDEEVWIIKTSPESYQAVKDAVDAAKLPVLEAKIINAASTSAEIPADKLKSFLKLVDMLEDNDDVQNVWHNADYEEPEE